MLKKTLLALAAFSATAMATIEDDVAQLQSRWAAIKYELPAKQQEAAMATLAQTATTLKQQNEQRADVLIWHGIIYSSYAGIKGGLGALSLVKEAKSDFEKAMTIDKTALNGSALTSLGSLYYQVPGWPIGFGDDDKARELLSEGVAVNPEGIDSNYFYADFLFDQGEYKAAASYLDKAASAPARVGREQADQGRQQEIAALRQKLAKKLK